MGIERKKLFKFLIIFTAFAVARYLSASALDLFGLLNGKVNTTLSLLFYFAAVCAAALVMFKQNKDRKSKAFFEYIFIPLTLVVIYAFCINFSITLMFFRLHMLLWEKVAYFCVFVLHLWVVIPLPNLLYFISVGNQSIYWVVMFPLLIAAANNVSYPEAVVAALKYGKKVFFKSAIMIFFLAVLFINITLASYDIPNLSEIIEYPLEAIWNLAICLFVCGYVAASFKYPTVEHIAQVKEQEKEQAIKTTVNSPDKYGVPPLVAAVANNDMAQIKLLLANPLLDVNQVHQKTGNTALSVACWNGNSEIVDMLLAHKDINKTHLNAQGRTPEDLAMAAAYFDIVHKF